MHDCLISRLNTAVFLTRLAVRASVTVSYDVMMWHSLAGSMQTLIGVRANVQVVERGRSCSEANICKFQYSMNVRHTCWVYLSWSHNS